MSIYQHFRPEEKEFIDQAMSWKEFVEQKYVPKLTGFLDPREQQIVKVLVGQQEVKIDFFGGIEQTERKRAILYPEYDQVTIEDYGISLFEIQYPKKFVNLTHPQILGSLMSLGLKREKFGDIVLAEDRAQFFCAEEISEYIQLQLQSIGRASVNLLKLPLSEGLLTSEEWKEEMTTVSSLRLDGVISSIYNISRQKSQSLIEAGSVKVNWTSIETPAFQCGEGDTLSIRGLGRSKIISIDGKTKREKWRIFVGRQK
jgi:RNA-binding protein YlmH